MYGRETITGIYTRTQGVCTYLMLFGLDCRYAADAGCWFLCQLENWADSI